MPEFYSRNFSGGNCMVWGAIHSTGTVALAFISNRMNSLDYQNILQNHLLPFLHRRQVRFVFQQDGASIHVSKCKNGTIPWLKNNNVELLEGWPARSPDLNIIENLWGILTHRIYSQGKQYNSVDELKATILQAWNEISLDTIRNLYRSLPNRMLDTIEKQGKHIDK